MIKCPDCGREVSDRAAICPQCSAPIATAQGAAPPSHGGASTTEGATKHACIHCGSTDLSYSENKQGFGAGKALLGAVVFGPLGLVAGAINRNRSEVLVRCNRCFKQFTAEKMVDLAVTPASSASAAPDPRAVFKCPQCGAASRSWTAACRSCGAKMPIPGWTKNPTANGILAIAMIVGMGWCGAKVCSSSSEAHAADTSSPQVSAPADDLAAVVSKFGSPDADDSTQYDKPRPPMVTRWVVFKKERVRAIFVPDAPTGSPPPYDGWKLVGFQDERSKQPLTASEANGRLKGRTK